MLEIAIAVGIGLWFVICGIVCYIAIDKTFKNDEKSVETENVEIVENEEKGEAECI